MRRKYYERFAELRYEDFRRMSTDPSLSLYEKAGFPDELRAGKEQVILSDLLAKLPPLAARGKTVFDIGPGVSPLATAIIRHCEESGHNLVLIDAPEILNQLPDSSMVQKRAAYYPECAELLRTFAGRVDCILCYSVFHYVFVESNVWRFLDESLRLLAPGGHFLVGDIPNASKRKRFLSSDAGVAFHKGFIQTQDPPDVQFNKVEPGVIDDTVVIALVSRARLHGCDAYILPQADELPMANRREDVLIVRP